MSNPTTADYLAMQARLAKAGKIKIYTLTETKAGQKEIGKGGIQDEIEGWFKRLGACIAWARSRTDKPTTTELGNPDFTGSFYGKAFAFECKRKGQKPSPKQRDRLYMWKVSGAITAVVHSLAEAQAALGTTRKEP